MALLKLTLVALSLAVYYSGAMQSTNPSSNQTSRTTSRQVSLTSNPSFGSRSGEPAAETEEENVGRVVATIDQDPCLQYQEAKTRLQEAQASQGPSRSTSRGSRDSTTESVSPNKSAALRACATAVNAFRALPDDLKTKCPRAYGSDCRMIDGDFICSVLFTKSKNNILGCFGGTSNTSLSLRKCASEALKRRDEALQAQRNQQAYDESYGRLYRAASQTEYGRSTTTPARSRPRPQMNQPMDQQALDELVQRRLAGRGRGNQPAQPPLHIGFGEIQPASRPGSGEIQPASRQGSGELPRHAPGKEPYHEPSFKGIGRLPTDKSGCSSQPPPPQPPNRRRP
ncbi:uncharacterized protein [Bemisia tabaci]|uniref:uncharacterized protein n=1 Tax=Bemisia tabaci TaxID=7038 RepID=UPI003B28CF56